MQTNEATAEKIEKAQSDILDAKRYALSALEGAIDAAETSESEEDFKSNLQEAIDAAEDVASRLRTIQKRLLKK